MLRTLFLFAFFLGATFSATAQITQSVNNSDWNAVTWGSPASAPSSGSTYTTTTGLANSATDPVGVAYTSTLRSNDVSGISTFGGSLLTVAGNTRLLLKQNPGDAASASLVLSNNCNVILATSVPGAATLSGTMQVPAGVTAYLGLNNTAATSLTVTSTLTGSGTLALGIASDTAAEALNLNGNLSAFTGNISIYTAGSFSIGTNANLPQTTLAITNTTSTFALNNVITVKNLTVGTVAISNGSYTAAQLNTASGTSVFSGTGSIFVGAVSPSPVTISDGRASASMYPSGIYQVSSTITGWTFGGYLPSPTTQLSTASGTDSIGAYQQLTFSWLDASARQMTGTVNLYTRKDSIVFSDTLVAASANAPSPFPNFTTIPQSLSIFSYANADFAPPTFSVGSASTLWMLFDANANAMLISPASHFVPASLIGDGRTQIASGFNSNLANPPAGFTQKTVMSMSSGINHTFNTWGTTLTNLYSKVRPANDSDTLLRYYGYWTDNGAFYYYNYNSNATAPGESAYEATLQSLIADFGQKGIPIHYLQLDSWWYDKSNVSYNGGNAGGYHGGVPQQPWALFGGELNWAGDSNLFPSGVGAYSQSLGTTETQTAGSVLPFVCHARWIDTTSASSGMSTFYSEFGGYGTDFTGIVGTSSRFWNSLATYAKANQIQVYEQDWLEEMINYSPALTSTVDQGDALFDNMAAAFAAQNVDIQYCIPLPSCFLQASKYANVTTTRASGDRFQSSNYHNFLYTSRFSTSLGIWPWTDLFMSTETNNLLMSDLSAGPVGTGDSMGNESASNLLLAIRGDGVIIKPDSPLVPTDASYIAESAAAGTPLIASTNDNNGVTTTYAVAVPQSGSSNSTYSLSMTDLGVSGPAYVYDYFAQSATKVASSGTVSGSIASGGLSYFVVAPVGQSGIAFLGDLGKFVSNGKKRIKSVTDQTGQLSADVLFAPSETQVTLHGYSSVQPVVSVQSGQAGTVAYNSSTGHFTVAITPSSTAPLNNDVDPAKEVIVTFSIPTAPTITSNPPTIVGMAGASYNFSFVASGYPNPTFSLMSGNLPTGLTLSPNGSLTGIAAQAGTFSGTVMATNASGSVSQSFTITIASATDTPTLPQWALALLVVALIFIAGKYLVPPSMMTKS